LSTQEIDWQQFHIETFLSQPILVTAEVVCG
jgi:hypothetical protein